MNFYPPPPTITAEVYVRISDELRCDGQETEWRGGSALPFSGIFLEGPTTDDKGNLFITDIPYGRILQVDAEKNITECARWDGEPNGLVIREDGQFVVADYKQGLMLFDPSTGKVTPFLTRRNLERFKGPNDLIIDSKNNIYFTDQGQTGMTDQTGISPNGLVLSLDERFLYVAMTRANQVWRLPLHKDGTTTKAGCFFQSFGNAGPDGWTIDEEGNLFICHPSLGSVFVVDELGVPKARIVSSGGMNFTNCTFGGQDNKTLYITDSLEGTIQTVRWHVAGALKPRYSKLA